MDWGAVEGIAEVTGVLLVVVSLLFVGFQIRQNTTQLKQDNLLKNIRGTLDTNWSYHRDPVAFEVFRKGCVSFENLPPNEQAHFHSLLMDLSFYLEMVIRLHQAGLIEQDAPELNERYFLAALNTTGGTAILHLGMTGSVFIVDRGTPAGVHDHFDIELDSGKVLRFRDPRRFGSFFWRKDPLTHPLLANLGPEPLDDRSVVGRLGLRFVRSSEQIGTERLRSLDGHELVAIGDATVLVADRGGQLDPRGRRRPRRRTRGTGGADHSRRRRTSADGCGGFRGRAGFGRAHARAAVRRGEGAETDR